MLLSLDIVLAVCRRTWLKTIRRPVSLTFSFVQPLMWILFFGFLFHRFPLESGMEGIGYTSFLLPGVCAMTVLFGASQSGISLIRDMQTRFLYRMLATPAGSRSILGGKILADGTRLLAQALGVLGLGLLLGARAQPTLPGLLLGFLVLGFFGAAFASLSCWIALKSRNQETMATFVHVVNMPLLFTSSALVPGKQMPDWLQTISQWNPLTLAVDSFRAALLFGETPSVSGALLPLGIAAAVLFLASSVVLGRTLRA